MENNYWNENLNAWLNWISDIIEKRINELENMSENFIQRVGNTVKEIENRDIWVKMKWLLHTCLTTQKKIKWITYLETYLRKFFPGSTDSNIKKEKQTYILTSKTLEYQGQKYFEQLKAKTD